MLLSYKPLHLEAQQRLQEEGCVVDVKCTPGGRARREAPRPARIHPPTHPHVRANRVHW